MTGFVIFFAARVLPYVLCGIGSALVGNEVYKLSGKKNRLPLSMGIYLIFAAVIFAIRTA